MVLDSPSWFAALTSARLISGTPSEATAICHDSRRVIEGAVFVAVPGLTSDGNSFIPAALARGARAIIVQSDHKGAWDTQASLSSATVVAVSDARVALAEAAAGFYGHPARKLGMIGVTGTDGKTTTTHLIAHVLNATGKRTGYLSSVEFGDSRTIELNATHMTTVEANEVQRYLAQVRDANAKYAVVEASSIGLDLRRVDQCEFDVGVLTNLTPDHLDYHKTMERYRDAKSILFRMLGESLDKGVAKAAVVNADDPVSAYFRGIAKVPVVTYGVKNDADITTSNIVQDGLTMSFAVRMNGRALPARVNLFGDYNAANCIAAIAVAVTQGVDLAAAVEALTSFPGVPGRMEIIDEGQSFRVVVDIASTEQAMRNVLRMLRPITPGKLIVVFGAAGERDTARRSTIARAVTEVADEAIITNEDPRTEDPDAILDEIEQALKNANFSNYTRKQARREAIKEAFTRAAPGDTVLLAGKATEQSIVIDTTHHPWDERLVARELLQKFN